VAIRLDGKEIFKTCYYDWQTKRDLVVKSNVISKAQVISYWDYWDKVHLEAKNFAGFDQYGFYEAFYEYHNQSIEKSLVSSDPVVRMFAILDKRVGKRKLQDMLAHIEAQPEWLQVFFSLRLETDGIIESVFESEVDCRVESNKQSS